MERGHDRGLTLLQLLVVVLVVSVYVAWGIASVAHAREEARIARTRRLLSAIQIGLQSYREHFLQYPPSMQG